MKPKVDAKARKQLLELNRRFYVEAAPAFDASRSDPWPGWERAVARLARAPRRVLDVGCGNGRFARFLADRFGGGFHYTGVDSSPALLERARASTGDLVDVEFVEADVLEPDAPFIGRATQFDLIAVFGLLHHVPGQESRRSLLSNLLGRLEPEGALVATAWQFGTDPRLRRRILPWEAYNENADDPIDASRLESGDHLLRFANEPAPRFCHHMTPEELHRLLDRLGVDWLDAYRADGRSGELNAYAVVRRTG